MSRSCSLVGCRLVALAFMFFGGGTTSSAQPPDARLTKVLQDWRQRQSRLDAIRYRVQGEMVYAKGSATDETGRPYNPPKPARDMVGKVEWNALLDFAGNRHRWEIKEETLNFKEEQLVQKVRINVCDGTIAQNSTPAESNPGLRDGPMGLHNLEMTIVRGNLNTILFPGGSRPLFFGHGIIPTSEDRLYAGHLRRKYSDEQFYLHGTGLTGGRPCLILRTEALRTSVTSFHEYWVDSPRQSAVTRYARYTNGAADENYDIENAETPHGWLPGQWTHSVYMNGRTHTVERLRVQYRDAPPPFTGDDFSLQVKPGMRVREVNMGDTANPLVMPPIANDKVHEWDVGDELVPPRFSPATIVGAVLGLTLLASLALGSVLMLRRRARARFLSSGLPGVSTK